jgi:TgpA N-terminal domain/Transglutaminase-like superfamily
VTAAGSRYLVPVSAGLAVELSSTALSGVLDGYQWLWRVLLAITVVVVVGMAARACRLPTAATLPVQLIGLVLVLTSLFGKHQLLGVLPTAATVHDLAVQLSSSIEQIETGIPPVTTTPALSLLVTLGFGVLMLVVDPLVMAGHGPAICGLALLGGYTVPTALDPDALPSPTLVAGAAGYTLHLMLAHRERQARRGILAESPRPPSAGSPLHRRILGLRAASRAATGTPIAVVLTAVALVFALGLSSFATMIGTDGRFSGNGWGHAKKSNTEFGLNPFTTLHSELAKAKDTELMRVSGLPGPQYLRALTLSRYVPQQGWQLPDQRNGVDMNGPLPSGMGIPVNNPTATIHIQNLDYKDRWLPLYGTPMSVTGLISGRWQYDVITNTAYADSAVTEATWTERAALPNPNVATLETSEPAQDVDPSYLDTGGITNQIGDLARAITRNAASPFEKAVTLNRYFVDPANGYHYSLKTAPGSNGDALEDFLFRGKTGYCEQFSSAMAVMLREVGVPARVAIGFTSGTPKDGYSSITSSDAHAWVEGYFAGVGWLNFDPTPLGDGRTVTPSYVAQAPTVPINVPPSVLAAGQGPEAGQNGPPPPPAQSRPSPSGPGQAPRPAPGAGQSPGQGGGQQGSAGPTPASAGGSNGGGGNAGRDQGGNQSDNRHGDNKQGDNKHGDQGAKGGQHDGLELSDVGLIALLTLLAILAVGVLSATPAAVRAFVRRRRLARAARGGPGGAEAAWRELLAEFEDRGTEPSGNDTVRGSARKLSRAHRLDSDAVCGMRTVVGAVERGWYAPPTDPGPRPDLVAAVHTVRGGLRTSAPLSVGARLWPRSIVPKWRGPSGP